MRRRGLTLQLCAVFLGSLFGIGGGSSRCQAQEAPPPPTGPALFVASPAEGEIVPVGRAVVNVLWFAMDAPVNRASLRIVLDPLAANARDLTSLAIDVPDGVMVQPPESAPFPDGPHELRVELADTNGLRSDASVHFTVDTLPPTVVVATGGAEGVERSATGAIWIYPVDATLVASASSLRAILDPDSPTTRDVTALASWMDGAWRLAFSGTAALSEGYHTLRVEVADMAGNVAVALQSFSVDLTPPLLTLVDPSPDAVVTSLAPRIEATYTDAVSGIDVASARLWVNGALLSERVTATADRILFESLQGLPFIAREGMNSLTVAVKDRAGWERTVERAFTVALPFPPNSGAPPAPPAPSVSLLLLQGDAQSGLIGRVAPTPIVVKAMGSDGLPVSGLSVSFLIESGGGAFSEAPGLNSWVTDASGIAGAWYGFASEPGPSTLKVIAVGGTDIPPVRIQATAYLPGLEVVELEPRLTGSSAAVRLGLRVVDGFGAGLPDVEVLVPENPANLLVMPTQRRTDGAGEAWFALGPSDPSTEIVVRLPGFAQIRYQGAAVAEARIPAAFVEPYLPDVLEAEWWALEHGILKAGGWQVVDPAHPFSDLDLDLTGLQAHWQARIDPQSDPYPVYQGIVISDGPRLFNVGFATKVRLRGLRQVAGMPDHGTYYLHASVVDNLSPAPPQVVGVYEDGWLVVDMASPPAMGPGWALGLFFDIAVNYGPPQARLVVEEPAGSGNFVDPVALFPFKPLAAGGGGGAGGPPAASRLHLEARLPRQEPATTTGKVIARDAVLSAGPASAVAGALASSELELALYRVREEPRYALYRSDASAPVAPVSGLVGEGQSPPTLPAGFHYVQVPPGGWLDGFVRADLEAPFIKLRTFEIRWMPAEATPQTAYYVNPHVQTLPSLAVPDLADAPTPAQRQIQGATPAAPLTGIGFSIEPLEAWDPLLPYPAWEITGPFATPASERDEIGFRAVKNPGLSKVQATCGAWSEDTLTLALHKKKRDLVVAVWLVADAQNQNAPELEWQNVGEPDYFKRFWQRDFAFWRAANAAWGPCGFTIVPMELPVGVAPGRINYPGDLSDGVVLNDITMLNKIYQAGWKRPGEADLNLYLVKRVVEKRTRKNAQGQDESYFVDWGGFRARDKRACFIAVQYGLKGHRLAQTSNSFAHELGHACGIEGDYGKGLKDLDGKGDKGNKRLNELMAHGEQSFNVDRPGTVSLNDGATTRQVFDTLLKATWNPDY